MIKRLLLFAALVTASLFALFALVGDDSGKGTVKEEPRDENPQPVVQISRPDGKGGYEIVVSGALKIPVRRQVVPLPGGGSKILTLCELRCEDSKPLPNNTQLLIRVRVDFAEVAHVDGKPVAKLTSWMVASEAVLQLSQDEKGHALLAEDKQMEFWDVVVHTTDTASIPNARITLEHAMAINAKDGVSLWTPTDDVPVHVLAKGPDGFEITGLGMRAWLPARRDPEGKVKVQDRGEFRFTIASEPVLVRGDTTLRSRGRLQYREVLDRGVAKVSMEDRVSVRGLARQRQPHTGNADFVARGRKLDAVLVRTEQQGGQSDTGSSRMVWNRIVLVGEPATLVSQDKRLSCQRLDVLPDPSGEPYWFIASGPKPTMHQEGHQEGRGMRIEATGPVHLVRLRNKLAALLAGFGIPDNAVPRGVDEVVLFEGPATVFADEEQLVAFAADGLIAVGSSEQDSSEQNSSEHQEGSPVTLLGRGKVRVTSPEWTVQGNNGFRIRETSLKGHTKTAPRLERDIRLGPDGAGKEHVYRIDRRATDRDRSRPFTAHGSGACRLYLNPDQGGELFLFSPAEDVHVELRDGGGELRQVRQLHVGFQEGRGVLHLTALGRDCRARYVTVDGVVNGRAAEIRSPQAGVLRLIGQPLAEVQQENPARVLVAREIVMLRIGARAAVVKAHGDARLRLRQVAEKGAATGSGTGTGPVDIELLADKIRLLPYLVPPHVRQVYQRGAPAAIGLLAHAQSSPYLFAEGNVRLIQREPGGRVVGRGFGDRLVLRMQEANDQASRAIDGKLVADGAARLQRLDRRGREHVAEARVIRFTSDKRGQYMDLLPDRGFRPRLTVPAVSNKAGAHADQDGGGRTVVVCDGRIAITPDKIRFLGPLKAQSLDKDGRLDPTGLQMQAKGMVMDRNKAGEVTHITAKREIRFHFDDIDGEADEMSVNLLRNLIIAKGTTQSAVLRRANGDTIRAIQVNYNYRTKRTESWNGRFEVTAPK